PELSLARRPGGEGRFALSAAGGDYDGVVGMRVQATAQLLLRPGDRTGLGPYAGLGLAFVGAEAAHGAGYLTAVRGVDAAPRPAVPGALAGVPAQAPAPPVAFRPMTGRQSRSPRARSSASCGSSSSS